MMIKIREHEFEFDVFDLDASERLDKAEDALKGKVDADDLAKNPSIEKLKLVYDALVSFFDAVLGEGSLQKILDGKRNPLEGLDAYYDLRDALYDSATERAMAVSRRSKLPDKYNPEKLKRGKQ